MTAASQPATHAQTAAQMDRPLLSVRGLVTEFVTPLGVVHAVNHVSFDVYPGETVGVVGESGSGKSIAVRSVLGLVPQPPGRIVAGEAIFEGRDLLSLDIGALSKIRGREIAMIFQDPGTSLNPVLTVGRQICEALRIHQDMSLAAARERSVELLRSVGIPHAEARIDDYPHQYSGGMRQRAMIAMAMANRPRLLIADEPTTALDVTTQAQVLDVLKRAKRETEAATILITHDLGLIAEMADRVVVMYAGRVLESGSVFDIFHRPRHPYTLGLLASLPRIDTRLERLYAIRGAPPTTLPPGCAFHPRCDLSQGRARCFQEVPPLYDVGFGHGSACHFHVEIHDQVRATETEPERQ
jgi:oligopeptide/dipeptide ABC transporter ATP-binding protein